MESHQRPSYVSPDGQIDTEHPLRRLQQWQQEQADVRHAIETLQRHGLVDPPEPPPASVNRSLAGAETNADPALSTGALPPILEQPVLPFRLQERPLNGTSELPMAELQHPQTTLETVDPHYHEPIHRPSRRITFKPLGIK